MKAKFRLLLLAALPVLLLCTACSEIFEYSIQEEKVTVLLPGPDLRTTNYNVTFWWEEVEWATRYELQVVSPRFDSVQALVLDTVVTGNKFVYSLAPGAYQWRIRAANGSSRTAYFTQNLYIEVSTLPAQTVLLSAPADNQTFNTGTTFRWEALYGAQQYRLQVDTLNFGSRTPPLLDVLVTSTSYPYTFPGEGRYQWRVRAENDQEQSQWSRVQQVGYDATPPAAVAPTAPANNAVNQPVAVLLRWTAGQPGDSFKIFIYKNTETNLVNTFTSATNSFTYNGAKGEVIFWRIKAVDAAGNESDFSPQWKFTIGL